MNKIQIPYNWTPRPYQVPVWNYFMNGGKRAALVAHRRWGKDEIAGHLTAVMAMQKPATYWHMLPQAAQARKAIWEAVNPHTGIRRIDEWFPPEIREAKKEQEMMIKFTNGSTWQVVGSDNYNSLVGSPPYGVVLSEWSLADPSAWAYLRPILLENGGYSLFIYTSRGKNHGYKTFQLAQGSEDWYAEKSAADKTGVFTEEQLQTELLEYQSDYGDDAGKAFWLQEYFCSFESAIPGAYYAGELVRAESENRITRVPYDKNHPVETWWDIGRNDYTAIWFAQKVGYEIRLIDYYQANMRGPEHYAQELKNRGYFYSTHNLPHDADYVHMAAKDGKSVKEQFQDLMPGEEWVAHRRTKSEVSDIYVAKAFFARCVFDQDKCSDGLDSLGSFAQEWSDKYKVFTGAPAKGWFKHGADAFRYLAVGYQDTTHVPLVSESGTTFAGAMMRNRKPKGRTII